MPRRKLTLSVDEAAIRKARRYSRKHDTSISELVSRFLDSLSDESEDADTPVVSRLRGVLPRDADRQAHRDHLRKKHGL